MGATPQEPHVLGKLAKCQVCRDDYEEGEGVEGFSETFCSKSCRLESRIDNLDTARMRAIADLRARIFALENRQSPIRRWFGRLFRRRR